MDALANPSLQRGLSIALAAVAALGLVTCVLVLWSARRSISAQARVLRRRVGVVALFVAVAAGASGVVLSLPIDTELRAPAPTSGSTPADDEVVSARRFSSAKLPALSLDAPEGWHLELDKGGHKLSAKSDGARLLISTVFLKEVVDVDFLLGQLAERQRGLGYDVGDTTTDRLGDLPAAGFLATVRGSSVSAWMVRRDAHLASSVICSSDGKVSARDACRAALASLHWRAPAR